MNQERAGRRGPENDNLDREIDAALAKYAAVEPRGGLENRILAKLGAERERAAARVWRWPVLGLAAAVLVVAAVSTIWKLAVPKPDITAHQPTMTGQGAKQPGTRIATNDVGVPVHPTVPAVAKRPAKQGIGHQVTVANGPRLDQFPSPRPLSEEEKLLVRYVQNFPQDAVMIAQAQAESEAEIETYEPPLGTQLDQQSRQQSSRKER